MTFRGDWEGKMHSEDDQRDLHKAKNKAQDWIVPLFDAKYSANISSTLQEGLRGKNLNCHIFKLNLCS